MMPEASGRHPHQPAGADAEGRFLAELVKLRSQTLLGTTIVGHGSLVTSELGHPAGTPFVLIQVDCSDEAEYAEAELAEIAGIAGDWHGGWCGRRVSGDYVMERKIFPTLQRLAAAGSSS